MAYNQLLQSAYARSCRCVYLNPGPKRTDRSSTLRIAGAQCSGYSCCVARGASAWET